MGLPPRKAHNNRLHRPDELRHNRALQVPRLPPDHPVHVRRHRRQTIHPSLHAQGETRPANDSQLQYITTAPPRRLHQRLSRTLRIRRARSHRLHHLHPGQIMQAPARHVLTHHAFQEEVPTVQVSRRGGGDLWRGGVYFTFWVEETQSQHALRPDGLGYFAARHQPAIRRVDQQHAGLYLQHVPAVHRPPDDDGE